MAAIRCPLEFDASVTRCIRITAHRVALIYRLNSADEEDLRQEMYLGILQKQHLFDPSRSLWKTFVKLITQTTVKLYLRQRFNEKLEITGCPLCGDLELFVADGMEELPDICLPDSTNQRLLLMNLQDVFPRLAPLIRRLCQLALAGFSRDEMAAIVGLSRSSVDYRMKLLWSYLNGEFNRSVKKNRVLFHKNAQNSHIWLIRYNPIIFQQTALPRVFQVAKL